MEVEVRVAFHSLDSGRTSLLFAVPQGRSAFRTGRELFPTTI